MAEPSSEDVVPVEAALPGMRIASLPASVSWVGAMLFIKTTDNEDGGLGWSVRRTEDVSDRELLGLLSLQIEMLRERIFHDQGEEH